MPKNPHKVLIFFQINKNPTEIPTEKWTKNMTWQFTEKENNLPVYAMIYLTTEKHILKQQDTEKQSQRTDTP